MAKTDSTQADIIADRKAGKEITAIAKKYNMDKMDVRDICKDVQRVPAKKASK